MFKVVAEERGNWKRSSSSGRKVGELEKGSSDT